MFCRDKPAQDVQKVILIYTNDDYAGRQSANAPKSPSVDLLDHCPNTYSGTFSGSYTYPGGGTLNWNGSVTFSSPGAALAGQSVAVTSGSVAWSVSGTDQSGCTWSGGSGFALTNKDGVIYVYPNGTYLIDVAATGTDPPANSQQTVTIDCQGATSTVTEAFTNWLDSGVPQTPTGSLLRGSYSLAGMSWSWDLNAGG